MSNNERPQNKELGEADSILVNSYPLLTEAAGHIATLDIRGLYLGVSTIDMFISNERNDSETFFGRIIAYKDDAETSTVDKTLASLLQSHLILPYLPGGKVYGLKLNVEGYDFPPDVAQAKLLRTIIDRYYADAITELPPMTTTDEALLDAIEKTIDGNKKKIFQKNRNVARRILGLEVKFSEN